MPEFETLGYEESDGVAWVTLNRPDVMNAFNTTMQRELRDLWRWLRRHDDVRVVVLTGAGDKAFCTGIDRSEALADGPRPGRAGGAGAADRPAPRAARTSRCTSARAPRPFMFDDPGENLGPKSNDLWKPVIAAVNGIACGGAFYMLGEVDFMIAADHATFFDPHLTFNMAASFEPLQMTGPHALRRPRPAHPARERGAHERRSGPCRSGSSPRWCRPASSATGPSWAAGVIAKAHPVAVQGTLRALWAGRELSARPGARPRMGLRGARQRPRRPGRGPGPLRLGPAGGVAPALTGRVLGAGRARCPAHACQRRQQRRRPGPGRPGPGATGRSSRRRHLGVGPAVAPVGDEDGVVAEAARPPPARAAIVPSTTPWATTSRPPGKQAMATVRNRARRRLAAAGPGGVELGQQLGHVVVVGGVLTGVARRVHTRAPRPSASTSSPVSSAMAGSPVASTRAERLEPGVLLQGVPGLLHLADRRRAGPRARPRSPAPCRPRGPRSRPPCRGWRVASTMRSRPGRRRRRCRRRRRGARHRGTGASARTARWASSSVGDAVLGQAHELVELAAA